MKYSYNAMQHIFSQSFNCPASVGVHSATKQLSVVQN